MSYTIELPHNEGAIIPYTLREPLVLNQSRQPFQCRTAYAAVHVVADPSVPVSQATASPAIDWEATLAYRRYLWSLGFAVAEAMDTAQRGMGLDWPASQELIRRSLADAKAVGGGIACGAGTDHLAPDPALTLDEVVAAYEEQIGFVEGLGGRAIMMASRALAAVLLVPTTMHKSTHVSLAR